MVDRYGTERAVGDFDAIRLHMKYATTKRLSGNITLSPDAGQSAYMEIYFILAIAGDK
jgi:hypothetical protein